MEEIDFVGTKILVSEGSSRFKTIGWIVSPIISLRRWGGLNSMEVLEYGYKVLRSSLNFGAILPWLDLKQAMLFVNLFFYLRTLKNECFYLMKRKCVEFELPAHGRILFRCKTSHHHAFCPIDLRKHNFKKCQQTTLTNLSIDTLFSSTTFEKKTTKWWCRV